MAREKANGKQCRRAVGEFSLPARRRVRSTKKGELPLLFFEFSGITRYLLLFPQCGHGNDGIILRICKPVSSSETEDSLPRIPHRAVRQPCSPFPMRFCDPPHYSRMRSHTVPDPSLFSCSALYLPKPRYAGQKDNMTTISKTPAMLYVSVPKSRN